MSTLKHDTDMIILNYCLCKKDIKVSETKVFHYVNRDILHLTRRKWGIVKEY